MAAADTVPREVAPRWSDRLSGAIEVLGDWGLFAGQTLRWCVSRRPSRGTFAHSLYTVGVQTAPVVVITGLFIGMVLAVHFYSYFNQFDMASRQGSSINLAIVRELGPVLVATMLAGRVGSAMAAELASMRVTEQVDALAVLGVNPLHYLVVPRFLACVLLIPLLTVVANFVGVLGSAFISIQYFGIDSHHYWEHAGGAVTLWDLNTGLIKPVFFGAAIALISCHRGLRGGPGSEGVGRAATEAFVASFVAILVLDFFLALLLNTLHLYVWGEAARLLD